MSVFIIYIYECVYIYNYIKIDIIHTHTYACLYKE